MKKIICKKEYDTETATLIKKVTYGYYGDPAGYEEILFQTPEGLYFLYTRGGEASPYTTSSSISFSAHLGSRRSIDCLICSSSEKLSTLVSIA